MSSQNASLANLAKNQGTRAMNSSKRAANNQVGRFKKASPLGKVLMVLVVVFIFIFIVYAINVAWKQRNTDSKSNPIIVSSPIDAWKSYNTIEVPLPPEGLELSVSTWFYMKEFEYKLGQWKSLLYVGNKSGTETFPEIAFYPFTNSLKFQTTTSAPNGGQESCDIQNVPFNKWVHVVYVLNNRTTDIYVNGKLERSCVLQGLPLIKNKIYLKLANNGGFYGKIGRTQYFTIGINPNQIMNLYNRGPLGGTQYKVNFFVDGDIVKTESLDGYNSS